MTVTSSIGSTPTQAFVGGAWQDGGAGAFEVEDPATGAVLTAVADASPDQALAALAAAHEAFAAFRELPPRDRAGILSRAHDLVLAESGRLALLITLEMGKPLAEARAEVAYAASYLRWYAEEAVRVGGRYARQEAGRGRILVVPRPVGPCVFVTPWNFPLAMGARKIAPALATGCTCVVKPAEQTPLSTLALAQLLQEAGAPPGVVNVVPSSDPGPVVEPLLRDTRARKVSFTGSTEVGQLLLRQAADQVLRVSMELGGNAPFLVLADADVDRAVGAAMVAKMRNGGEACTAANRFYVHEAVAEPFAARLADRMARRRLGHGTDDGVDTGPLIDEGQRRRVQQLVDDAVAAGAEVRTGGRAPEGPGYFFEPTVLTGVPPQAAVLREEIFGPVAPVATFTDEDDAVARANATEHGLAAYVISGDLGRAMRVAERLETGMVGINQGLVSSADAPFGGVKGSGLGVEGGPEGLAEYLDTQVLAFDLEAAA